MLFAAAQHAFGLYRWFVRARPGATGAISAAADASRERPPTRSRRCSAPPSRSTPGSIAAASGRRCAPRLVRYWLRRGVTALPCPLLTGAGALGAEIPWARDDLDRAFSRRARRRSRGRDRAAAQHRAPLVGRPRRGRRPAPQFARGPGRRHPGRGPAGLGHLARPGARHGDQQRHAAARRVCRARHRQRGHPPREAPALRAQTSGAAARGRRPAPPPAARPPPRPAAPGLARRRRRK